MFEEILELDRQGDARDPKQGKRAVPGSLAKPDAHNPLECPAARRRNALRLARHAGIPFSDSRAESDSWVVKVRQKASGCLRIAVFAHAWCRMSSHMRTMAALAYNPLVAIALQGKAVDCLDQHV